MNKADSDFTQIHDTYRSKIYRYLARLVGESEAEDLTQEVFIKVSRSLENFRGESKVSTWLYRIATNAATDRLRSSSFQKTVQESLAGATIYADESEDSGKNARMVETKPLVEQQLVRMEMNQCIREFIEKLPEIYRTVLVLRELEGFENKEIAEILGVSLGTVKIRIHRAREKLRKELEQHCAAYWIEENEFIPDLKQALEDFREED